MPRAIANAASTYMQLPKALRLVVALGAGLLCSGVTLGH